MVNLNNTFNRQYEKVEETLEKMNWYMSNRDLDEKIKRLEIRFKQEMDVVSMQNFETKNDWKIIFQRLSDFDQKIAFEQE